MKVSLILVSVMFADWASSTIMDSEDAVSLSAFGALKTKIETLTTTVTKNEEIISELKAMLRCKDEFDGLLYNNKCYFVLVEKYNRDDAISACEQQTERAKLAFVDSHSTYEALQKFLRKIVIAEREYYMTFLLGASYNPQIGGYDITSLDGQKTATFARTSADSTFWYPVHPQTTDQCSIYSDRKAMFWKVEASASHPRQGLMNSSPFRESRPLCQAQLLEQSGRVD